MGTETARELLDKLLKRRAELLLESEALDNLIETYQRLLNISANFSQPIEHQPDLYRGATPRALHRAQVQEMVDAARRIMIAENRPLKRGELVKRLEAQGFEVVGNDKNKVFGTNLWRSGKFVTVEGKGYWPKGVELPQ